MRSLIFLLLVLPAQDPSVRDLLQKLEDDRAEAREKAHKDLAALGESVIPQLREVVESESSSGELKLRAAAAIREIELGIKAAKVYREPARVTVRAADDALRDVLDDLSRQSGVPIESFAVDNTARVSLEAKDVTLTEALDLICRGQAARTWEARDDGSIRLNRDRHVEYPAVHTGPFRVRVMSLNAERNNDFKNRTVSTTLTIQADWDRRLKPSKIVDIEIARAVDDRGTALDVGTNDGLNVFRGPGVQLRVGVGIGQDGSENSRTVTLKGLNPAATSVTLEGTARFTFPLDQREVRIEKPANTESKDLGDTTVRLTKSGTPENWSLSFHKPPTSTTPGWARTIWQRFDPDSFVVVDQDGAEFTGTLRQVGRGRAFQDAASEVGIWYQGVVQRNTTKAIKEVKFRFVDQTLVKSAPFKFTALPLP
jgi:hypothetical protein